MTIDLPDPRALRAGATLLSGHVAGIYFLYDGEELVYIGRGWNCFLGAAEQTLKDSDKRFTHWAFVPVEPDSERRALQRELVKQHSPRHNKI